MESVDSPRLRSIIQQLRTYILERWPCQTLRVGLDPVIAVQDFHNYSCSPRHKSEQEHRFNYMDEGRMLRRQLADSMPGFLRTMAGNPPEDLLLVCPGLSYQKGREETLQARRELAIWRLASHDLPLQCLDDFADAVAKLLPRGMRLRTRRHEQAYLVYSQGLEVYCGGWKWIGHCGLVNPMLLIENGFDPVEANAVALSLDLDRCVEVQDKWNELCLRNRSGEPIRTS